MNKNGPIVVIEDDVDDRDILKMVFSDIKCPNEIVYFDDGNTALDYLARPEVFPFLILSDINMPRLDGFELKGMVHTNNQLSKKCIPYLFFTTAVSENAVYRAYTLSAQGFFVKPGDYNQLRDTIRIMVDYWQRCHSPTNYVI